MASSFKGDIVLREADGTDYGSPDARRFSLPIEEQTDITQVHDAQYEAATGGTTVAHSIDTVYGFTVRNLSSSIDVDVAWTDSDSNSNTQVLKPGGVILVSEDDAAGNLTLTSDSDGDPGPLCRVLIWGKSVAA